MEHINTVVMENKLKVFSLLQKQEIPLVCPTETSFESVMTSIQDTNGIITGTGTTGCTIDGDTQNFTGDGMIGFTILILLSFLGAHLLDRKLNQDRDNQE